MIVQIKEIIIWSKKTQLPPRRIPFKEGKVNVIYGRSQSGKSAIINIIDYCLCSSENKLPAGIVQQNASWLGVILSCGEGEMLLARENLPKTKFSFYLKEGKNIEIPKIPCSLHKNSDFIKKILNDKFGIPFIANNEIPQINRLSFRDLVSFNFQPQFIIANPNCLLYKMDIAKYRERLKNIFDIALCVDDINNYINRKKIEILDNLKKEKIKEREKIIINEKNQLSLYIPIILEAQETGLLSEGCDITSSNDIKKALNQLASKNITNIEFNSYADNKISDRLRMINGQLNELYDTLKDLEIQKNNLEKFLSLEEPVHNLSSDKKKRLELAKFVKNFSQEYKLDIISENQLNALCENLEKIERQNTLNQNQFSKAKSASIEISESIIEKKFEINKFLKEYNELRGVKKTLSIWEKLYLPILKAKNYLEEKNENLERVENEIREIDEQIKGLKVDAYDVNTALRRIVSYIKKFLPSFAEFKNIDYFDKENLTLKVKNNEDESCFLYETGSASNWLAYHLATLLAFHKYFSENNSPVFNFLILDQPSQVFFPNGMKEENSSLSNEIDTECVVEIFNILNRFIADVDGKVQIIVLEHAKAGIWGNLENVIGFEENWFDEAKALIPSDWYS